MMSQFMEQQADQHKVSAVTHYGTSKASSSNRGILKVPTYNLGQSLAETDSWLATEFVSLELLTRISSATTQSNDDG